MNSLLSGRLRFGVWTLAGVAITVLLLPLAALVARTPWSSFHDVMSDSRVLDAIGLTAITSVITAGLAVAIGVPLAGVLAATSGRAASVLRALVIVPLVLPPVASGIALVSLLGRRGVIGQVLDDAFDITLLGTPAAVVIAQLFVSLPFLIITVEAGFRTVDERQLESAATLGASPFNRWRLIGLPMIGPSLVAGAALTWARAVGELGATLTFAGSLPGRSRTVPTEVLLLLETNPGAANVLSVVLLATCGAMLIGLRHHWLGRLL